MRAGCGLAAGQVGLDSGEHDAGVELGAGRLRVDAVGPEQAGVGRDDPIPVGELNPGRVPGAGRQHGVDLVLPGLRAVGVDQDELAVRADQPAQLADLAGGDGAVGAQADDDDVAQVATSGQALHDRQAGLHLSADECRLTAS